MSVAITRMEWEGFKKDYFAGKYGGQRFGQAFVNTHLDEIRGEQTQYLFYVESKADAIMFIEQNYVNWV